MTLASALRVVVPEHELTIMSAGGDEGLKAGLCRCGWKATESKDQDALGRQFLVHRAAAPAPLVSMCDCCTTRAASVRHGCVDLCGACALDELVRNGELEHLGATGATGATGVSGWLDGHPRRRGEPGQPNTRPRAVAVPA
jgi:hypothetical protein